MSTDEHPKSTKNPSTRSRSEFGKLLMTYRKRAGLSQEDLALLASLTYGAIGNYERGTSRPGNRDIAMGLVRALVQQGGIKQAAEANALLVSEEYAALSTKEVQAIWGTTSSVRDPNVGLALPIPQFPVDISRFEGLEDYFTNREDIINEFMTMLKAPRLAKKLIAFHGIGGIGKSSLLSMLYRCCAECETPAGYVTGESIHSVPELLSQWNADLTNAGISLSNFTRVSATYHRLQVGMAKEMRLTHRQSMQEVSTTSDGAILDEVLQSEEDAFQLLLEPSTPLTDAFLADVSSIAKGQRLVFMLDTYERLKSLDYWFCEFVRRLHSNVLVVFAGREPVDWHDQWDGWLAHVRFYPVTHLSPDHSRELISRYYSSSQVERAMPAHVFDQILKFSQGLPLAVTTSVRLWVRYDVEDFAVVEANVLRELTVQLRRGITPELIPIMEVAALLRYFNRSLIQAILPIGVTEESFTELCRFPFVRSDIVGHRRVYRIHDRVRELLNQALRMDEPVRCRDYHQRAFDYFNEEMLQSDPEEALHLELERLYHLTSINERKGVMAYRVTMEELERHQYVGRIQVVQNDFDTYVLTTRYANLWRTYYQARVAFLHVDIRKAEELLSQIIEDKETDTLLRAYALIDLGEIYARVQNVTIAGSLDKAVRYLEQGLSLLPKTDFKVNAAMGSLSKSLIHRSEWKRAAELLEIRTDFLEQCGDSLGVVELVNRLKDVYGLQGDWHKWRASIARGTRVLENIDVDPYLRVTLQGGESWGYIWSGNWSQAEARLREQIELERNRKVRWALPGHIRELGLVLAYQVRFEEAMGCFNEAKQLNELRPIETQRSGVFGGFLGYAAARQGDLVKAQDELQKSLSLKREQDDRLGIPELLVWLGQVAESQQNWPTAKDYYTECITEFPDLRLYFNTCALNGLGRIAYETNSRHELPELFIRIEKLAQEYEYNDQLALLRLIQGHGAWNGIEIDGGKESITAFHYYQQSLVYALRYNRFLLDEILSAGYIYTPLRTICSECLRHGEEGKRMLAALSDWWRSGTNSADISYLDSISPIPDGIALTEAERIARIREPGDGLLQQTVIMQLEATRKASSHA